VAELGNLTAGILLSLRRMSTVKIRARSLFRTPVFRIGAGGAGFGVRMPVENWMPAGTGTKTMAGSGFLRPPQPRSPLHRLYTGICRFVLAGSWRPGAKSDNTV
jgi:hypothetical protein